MALHSQAEIEIMLADTGGIGADQVSVTYETVTTLGNFDDPDERVLESPDGFGVVAGGPSVLVATGSIPAPVIDNPITVDGNAYTIRDAKKENDGAETRIWLRN